MPTRAAQTETEGALSPWQTFYSNTLSTLGQERGRDRTEARGRVISKRMLRLLGNSAVYDGVFINSKALVSDGLA